MTTPNGSPGSTSPDSPPGPPRGPPPQSSSSSSSSSSTRLDSALSWEQKDRLLAIVPKITGGLSLVCSMYLIQHILRRRRNINSSTNNSRRRRRNRGDRTNAADDGCGGSSNPSTKRQRRRLFGGRNNNISNETNRRSRATTTTTNTTYHRLVCGMSVADCFSSFFGFVLSTWPFPVDTGRWGASGNLTTMDIAGCFNQIGSVTTQLYNGMLALFYLLLLYYNWKDTRIRRIEPYLHFIPWTYGITTGILGLILKLYGPITMAAWIAPYPSSSVCSMNSPDQSREECIRGYNYEIYRNIFLYIPSYVTFVCTATFITLCYCKVRTIENRSKQYDFERQIISKDFRTAEESTTSNFVTKRPQQQQQQSSIYQNFNNSNNNSVPPWMKSGSFHFGIESITNEGSGGGTGGGRDIGVGPSIRSIGGSTTTPNKNPQESPSGGVIESSNSYDSSGTNIEEQDPTDDSFNTTVIVLPSTEQPNVTSTTYPTKTSVEESMDSQQVKNEEEDMNRNDKVPPIQRQTSSTMTFTSMFSSTRTNPRRKNSLTQWKTPSIRVRNKGSNNKRAKSRRVLRQGVLYTLAFISTWFFGLIISLTAKFSGKVDFAVVLCMAIFAPLQGLWNVLIYFRPIGKWIDHRRRIQRQQQRRRQLQLNEQQRQRLQEQDRQSLGKGRDYQLGPNDDGRVVNLSVQFSQSLQMPSLSSESSSSPTNNRQQKRSQPQVSSCNNDLTVKPDTVESCSNATGSGMNEINDDDEDDDEYDDYDNFNGSDDCDSVNGECKDDDDDVASVREDTDDDDRTGPLSRSLSFPYATNDESNDDDNDNNITITNNRNRFDMESGGTIPSNNDDDIDNDDDENNVSQNSTMEIGSDGTVEA